MFISNIEAEKNGKLNPFDALLISQISPGEIYGIMNSLQFAQDLVKEWLPKYKFFMKYPIEIKGKTNKQVTKLNLSGRDTLSRIIFAGGCCCIIVEVRGRNQRRIGEVILSCTGILIGNC